MIGVANAVSIASGRDHGIAVLADGSVMTWGHNEFGQLGDGTTTSRTRAVTVPGVTGAIAAGGGGSAYSAVLGDSGPAPNKPPTARFTVSCQQPRAPSSAGSSTDIDGTISAYDWDFGDGTTGSGETIDHEFANGTYQVRLTVTDDDGDTGTTTASVTVSDAPPAQIAFRAVRTFNGNVTRASVQVPTSVVPGDALVMFVSTARTATATTPAGWTLRGTVTDSDVRSWVYTRTAVAGTAGSTVQVSFDAISKTDVSLLAYSGAGQPSAAVEAGGTRHHGAAHLGLGAGRHGRLDGADLLGRQGLHPARLDAPRHLDRAVGDGRVRLRDGDRDVRRRGGAAGRDLAGRHRERRDLLGQGDRVDGGAPAGLS